MAGLNWRWMRGRGAVPVSFFVCSVLALVITLIGKTQAPLIDGARARLSDAASPALTGLRVPLVAFERWTTGIPTLFAVYQDNIKLREENAELRKWQNVALSLEDRMRRYEQLLNAAPGREIKPVTARVIGESNRPFVSTMILNAGAKDGVRKGQAVVDDRGLIGRIYLTGARTSWVILLTDLNSRIPVVVEPSHRRAILAGNNTAMPELELDVGDGKIGAGARVLTTGDGGLLPPDLPIGTVMEGSGAYQVSLFAGADASDYVQVLDYGEAVNLPVASAADVVPAAVDEALPESPAEKREAKRDSGPQHASLSEDVPEAADGEDR
jgi:rod shape-determining protein MreC